MQRISEISEAILTFSDGNKEAGTAFVSRNRRTLVRSRQAPTSYVRPVTRPTEIKLRLRLLTMLFAQRLVTAVLVLTAWEAGVQAAIQDYTAKFDANVQRFLSPFNETFTIETLSLPEINIPDVLELKVDLGDVVISGYASITGTQCTYDTDTTVVKMTLSEPSLEIFAHELAMKGVLFGNINIDGNGDGWFFLENFDMSIEGNTSLFNFEGPEPIIKFEDLTVILDLEQWTVDMRGLTPGSDLNQMMNSFFTMLGPEIFHALGDALSDSRILLPLVNRLFRDPNESTGTVPTDGQGETTPQLPETTDEPETSNPEENEHPTKTKKDMNKGVKYVNPDDDVGWLPQQVLQERLRLRHPRRMTNLGFMPSPLF